MKAKSKYVVLDKKKTQILDGDFYVSINDGNTYKFENGEFINVTKDVHIRLQNDIDVLKIIRKSIQKVKMTRQTSK